MREVDCVAKSLPQRDAFVLSLMNWYAGHKRALPWRETNDPYAILVSEVMLQQTQVKTVIPFYLRFLARFPHAEALADATEADLLNHWQGLGYYRRARLLQRAAQAIAGKWHGVFPREYAHILALPGVGSYTAAAVASIAFGLETACVDGNVVRVLTRVCAIDLDVASQKTMKHLQRLADALLDRKSPGDFNQAMMELGATVCTPKSPACGVCPVRTMCKTRTEGGSPELRPVKTKKVKVQHIELCALFLYAQGRFLLAQRPAEGLMGGMWELPAQEASAFKPWPLLLDRPVQPVARSRQPFVHRFTHLKASYHWEVFRALRQPRFLSAPTAYARVAWFAPADIEDIPITNVLHKLLPVLLREIKSSTNEVQSCIPL